MNENVNAMRCATRALSALPFGQCIESTDVLVKYCLAEFQAVAMCQGEPGSPQACVETLSPSPDGCVLATDCGSTYSVFECTGSFDSANCTCWTNEGLEFSFQASYPAEKACYDPAFTSACRPPGTF